MNANDIISITSNAISTNFPDAEIYKESIKQDFDTPSFYIAEINHNYNLLLGRASRKRFSMSIKYFPDENNTDDIKQELHEIAAQLTDILEIMSFDNKTIKAYNMESRIDDDILHFMFDVKVKTLKAKNVNKFGPLEVDVNVKD